MKRTAYRNCSRIRFLETAALPAAREQKRLLTTRRHRVKRKPARRRLGQQVQLSADSPPAVGQVTPRRRRAHTRLDNLAPSPAADQQQSQRDQAENPRADRKDIAGPNFGSPRR